MSGFFEMRRRGFNAALLAALSGLLGAAGAWAEKPRVVVVPYGAVEGATAADAAAFEKALVEALRQRDPELTLVPAPGAKPREEKKKDEPPAARAPKANPEALQALEAGFKAYADLKLEDAVTAIERGLELSLQDPANADWAKVLDAHVTLAVAAFRLGEEKKAQVALTTLARLSPAYELAAGFPPVFVREWEKSKKRAEKGGRQPLVVEGPAGATAFIDGRDLGMVPVDEQVPLGTHYVKVEGARGERFGQVVEVKAGASTKVKANFADKGGAAPAPAPVAAAVVADPKVSASVDAAGLERIAKWTQAAGADFALVGVVWRTGERELSAGTALYWTRKDGLAEMPQVTWSLGQAGPSVVAKIIDKLSERIESFGTTVALPHALLPSAANPDAVAAKDPDAPDVATPSRPTDPRLLPDGTRMGTAPLGQVDDRPVEVASSGPPKWIWIIVGVGLAAGAGVGTYFIVSSATRPVTGTVTATW